MECCYVCNIAHEGHHCPLCEANDEIFDLNEEIKELKKQIENMEQEHDNTKE